MNRDEKAELLIAALLHDQLLFFEIVNRLDKEIFSENEYNNFMIELRRFYKTFKKMPSHIDFKAFANIQQFPFADYVFQAQVTVEREVVRDRFYKNYQNQQALQFFERSAQKLDADALDLGDAFDDMRKTLLTSRKPDDSYIELNSQNIVGEYLFARDFRIGNTAPTIFRGMNKLMHGGIAPGELEIFIAASNRGKTLYLINELYCGLVNGEKCLYLTMENRAPSVIARLSDRMLLQDKQHQRDSEEFCLRFIKKFYSLVKPPVILYVPANTFSVDDLDIWLEEYQGRTGQKFDRILIDYLNKFKKKKARESWEEDRFLTDSLRALAIEKEARMQSAAQTSRAGAAIGRENSNTDTIDETMLQGGFGQFETADIVIGFSETPAEKAKGVGRIINLKTREAGGRGREFVVNVAPWIGLMTDCAETILQEEKRILLENPDVKYGQLPGLHEKQDGRPRRGKGKGKQEGTPEVQDTTAGMPEVIEGDLGVTL